MAGMRNILIVACVLWTQVAAAQFPERPIRLIVPQAAGSATDNIARLVAPEMAKALGQAVIVDNRPGGAPEEFGALIRREDRLAAVE